MFLVLAETMELLQIRGWPPTSSVVVLLLRVLVDEGKGEDDEKLMVWRG